MFADMQTLRTPGERLIWARLNRSPHLKATEAATAYGWTVSTYLGHENGDRNPSRAAAEKYAARYKVRWEWLLTGKGPPIAPNVVSVMGRIGAGAEILPEFEQIPPDGLFQIEVPIEIPHDAIAFEVEGDSMWPRYDGGDVVICWREGTDVKQVIGWEAAVRTSDGHRYLKRILEGSTPRTFDLESYNAPVIRGVKLDWVSRVNVVIRRGEWKMLNGKTKSPMRSRAG
jgi:transcriptional regulator with XRE-family HTH domain